MRLKLSAAFCLLLLSAAAQAAPSEALSPDFVAPPSGGIPVPEGSWGLGRPPAFESGADQSASSDPSENSNLDNRLQTDQKFNQRPDVAGQGTGSSLGKRAKNSRSDSPQRPAFDDDYPYDARFKDPPSQRWRHNDGNYRSRSEDLYYDLYLYDRFGRPRSNDSAIKEPPAPPAPPGSENYKPRQNKMPDGKVPY